MGQEKDRAPPPSHAGVFAVPGCAAEGQTAPAPSVNLAWVKLPQLTDLYPDLN